MEFFRATIELVNAIVWPMLLAGVLFAYRRPLRLIVAQLPRKLSAATKLGVGSLSLEIQAQARTVGNPELAQRLGRLSPEAIKRLISMGESNIILVGKSAKEGVFFLPTRDTLDVIRELSRNGLVDFREDLDDFLMWIETGPFDVGGTKRRSRGYFRTARPLTDEERTRLTEQYYKLNRLGSKAWEAVLEAILEELRAESPLGPTM